MKTAIYFDTLALISTAVGSKLTEDGYEEDPALRWLPVLGPLNAIEPQHVTHLASLYNANASVGGPTFAFEIACGRWLSNAAVRNLIVIIASYGDMTLELAEDKLVELFEHVDSLPSAVESDAFYPQEYLVARQDLLDEDIFSFVARTVATVGRANPTEWFLYFKRAMRLIWLWRLCQYITAHAATSQTKRIKLNWYQDGIIQGFFSGRSPNRIEDERGKKKRSYTQIDTELAALSWLIPSLVLYRLLSYGMPDKKLGTVTVKWNPDEPRTSVFYSLVVLTAYDYQTTLSDLDGAEFLDRVASAWDRLPSANEDAMDKYLVLGGKYLSLYTLYAGDGDKRDREILFKNLTKNISDFKKNEETRKLERAASAQRVAERKAERREQLAKLKKKRRPTKRGV